MSLRDGVGLHSLALSSSIKSDHGSTEAAEEGAVAFGGGDLMSIGSLLFGATDFAGGAFAGGVVFIFF